MKRSRAWIALAAAACAALAAPSPAAAGIYQQCRDVAAPIPEGSFAEARFNTKNAKARPPKGAKVRKLIVGFKIAHDFDQDLTLQVISPTGRTVTIAAGRGGAGDGYGTGTDCSVVGFASFFDAAPMPISAGTPPFDNSFRPQQPLKALKGTRARGVWIVRVSDLGPGGTGTLEAAKLNVESTNPNKRSGSG